jgi:hypothetical protein
VRYYLRQRENLKWRPWFAWHPVFFDRTIVWLERLERTWFWAEYDAEWRRIYRYPKKETTNG